MFADVILHRRVPSRFESFTYAVPEGMKLASGQIVTVPFGKQQLAAIVRSLHQNTPAFNTKAISKMLPATLPAWQLELAEWMAKTYGSSFAQAIDLFIPENIWKGKEQEVFEQHESLPPAGENIPTLQKFVDELLSTPSPKLVLERTQLPRSALYRELIACLPKGSQGLFLFPEVFSAKKFAGPCAVFSGEKKEKKKADIWHGVASSKISAIFGTRAALFLPFQKLLFIVLDMEENDNYTERRKPAYDGLEVAIKLSELWKIPLLTVSSAPRVTTWHKIEQKNMERRDWNATPPPLLRIVDLSDDRRKGNREILSLTALEGIARALVRQEQVLLFMNRKGDAAAMICSDCHEVVRCESCRTPQTPHRDGTLRCHRCSQSMLPPSQCPSCHGVRLKTFGAGTERLEREMTNRFSHAQILRLESGQKPSGALDFASLNEADILIGTSIVDKPLGLSRLKYAVVVSADQLLVFPDYRASEQAFQLLRHLEMMLAAEEHETRRPELLLQTFLPTHPLFQSLEKKTMEAFYTEELETRRRLSLPPFGAQLGTSAQS